MHALRLHVPILERCESRKAIKIAIGRVRLVAKLGDDSSSTRHEWVRRDAHAAKPSGSREVTHVSTATSLNPISDVTDRVLSILTGRSMF